MPIAAPTTARPVVTYTDSHTRACRRVGSQEVAEQLVSVRDELRKNYRAEGPAGWKRLGSGATRVAYLGPDGWVYKIALWGYDQVNLVETKFWQMGLAHRLYRPAVPHHRLFEVLHGGQAVQVLAMERLTMDEERARREKNSHPGLKLIHEMGAHIGCVDLHGGNIGWRGDHPVLLDAGGGTCTNDIARTDGCTDCNPRHHRRAQ